MPNTILGKVSITPRGEYSPTETYKRLDAVQYGGNLYLCAKTCIGVTPEDGEYYMLATERGKQGDVGPTPNLSIGEVATLAPGSDAAVTITGTPEAPVLNFGIPLVAVDDTLKESGKAADAKATGDAISNLSKDKANRADVDELKGDLNQLSGEIEDVNESLGNMTVIVKSDNLYDINSADIGKYRSASGNLVENSAFICTNLIDVQNITTLYTRIFYMDLIFPFKQVLKYDESGNFIERADVNATSYNVGEEKYVRFNIDLSQNGTLPSTWVEHGSQYLMIADYELTSDKPFEEHFKPYYYYDKDKLTALLDDEYLNTNNVSIRKNSSTEFDVKFGKGSFKLFYNSNETTNSENWNIGTLCINDNVVVPRNTDILGPVLINDNTDYVGGVHGDETTDSIVVVANGTVQNIENITELGCDSMIIAIKSRVFDEVTKDHVFDRFVQILVEPNKITVNNTYKAVAEVTLKRATNGGQGACYTNILQGVIIGSAFYTELPTETFLAPSKNNTMATLITNYGSLTVHNLKGYERDSYNGWLQHFPNESTPRLKIYLDTFKSGTYPLVTGDTISGEFEYIIN